jgi:glycosyltransferase involved in cell wall biosynthesis
VPLKVCLVADSLGPDAGTENLIAHLAAAFDPRVIEAHVCCLEASERLSALPAHVHTAVFPTVRVYSPPGLRQIWKFRQYLRRNRIDVVHSFMHTSSVFTVLAAWNSGCRAVITSRLSCGYWYSRRWIWAYRLLNRFSTHLLTNSVSAKNLTVSVEGASPEKITVFYQGVDLAKFAPRRDAGIIRELGLAPDTPVAGMVANFRPVKDVPLFLKAARVVSAAVPEARFLLVGQGALKPQLQRLAGELGISDRVFFSSPERSVADYLACMSVACLSSESEGFPNAILEYMAAGLPVVATDVGGVSEAVRDGFNGYLVGTRTPEAFAEPIIRLLRDRTLRMSMGQRGLERARTEFETGAAVRRLQDFYLEAAGGPDGRDTITRC